MGALGTVEVSAVTAVSALGFALTEVHSCAIRALHYGRIALEAH